MVAGSNPAGVTTASLCAIRRHGSQTAPKARVTTSCRTGGVDPFRSLASRSRPSRHERAAPLPGGRGRRRRRRTGGSCRRPRPNSRRLMPSSEAGDSGGGWRRRCCVPYWPDRRRRRISSLAVTCWRSSAEGCDLDPRVSKVDEVISTADMRAICFYARKTPSVHDPRGRPFQ